MKKIGIDGEFNFTSEQLARLKAVGTLEAIRTADSDEDWLKAVQGYDVVCTWGRHVLANLDKLQNVLVTYPYTELGSFDTEALAAKNVFVANARGGNKNSIVEWVMYMVLALYRDFPKFVRTAEQHPFVRTESLAGKKVLVIGHGTIGTEAGERCAAFGMQVDYFNRSDNLAAKAAQADVVINALSCNPSSKNLLDADFFPKLKKGAYFVSFVRPYTYDVDAMIAAIDAGVIAAAAIDCDPEPLFDVSNAFYQKCLSHEKILVTPHIAGMTAQAATDGLEIMVQNVERYLSGAPQNILKK